MTDLANSSRPKSNFIGGRDSRSTSDESIDLVNPSSGRVTSAIPRGSEEDVQRAVEAARVAFEDGRWRDAAPSARKRVLLAFADLIEAKGAELDAVDALEMGKPISIKRFGGATAAGFTRFCAESIDKLTGDVFTTDRGQLAFQRRVPRGVVAAIVPWNFPTFNAILKVAPALAMGNSVILKPSELSPSSAVMLAQLASAAGLPDGVLNVVLGLGSTVGSRLVLDMGVDMVAFTGSTGVGKQVMQYAGQSNLKAALIECGGKSPHVVFDDGIDVDAAAGSIAQMLLTNQGQICSVGSRLLVQRSIADLISERIRSHFDAVTIGDACAAQTTFGPLASQSHCERVLRYIGHAESEGATLASGGERILADTGGFFVEPTLFTGVKPHAAIAQEEVFGPVLAVIPFDTEEEAVRITNGTQYGLTAYVWTARIDTGIRMAKAIRSTVRVNAAVPSGEGSGFAAPIEPAGQSGFGAENGIAGLESYTRRQSVWFNHAA